VTDCGVFCFSKLSKENTKASVEKEINIEKIQAESNFHTSQIEYSSEITVNNLRTIEELLLGNYRQQTIVSAEGLCRRITLGQLPFVHVFTVNLLIVNHGKNTVLCNIHDIPKNYYLNNCKNNHDKSIVTCTVYDAPKKKNSRCIGKLL
jgi:hypothetical protein